MVAPCDKYQNLVFGPDGQTVKNPYGMLATLADYTEWREVAAGILKRANAELAREFEEHGALMEEEVDTLAMLNQEWEESGGWFDQALQQMDWTWGASIDSMVKLSQDAACELGVIEARIIEKGGDEFDIPTPPTDGTSSPTKGGGKGGGIGLILLLGLVALGASRPNTGGGRR